MLTQDQMQRIEREGFTTIDTPFTAEEVAQAAAATDRLFADRPEGFTDSFLEPALLHLLQHPFVEETAKQMLRADAVALRAVAIRKTAPKPEAVTALEGEHADVRYSLADWEASPRRVLCTILIWLTDVNPRRAPLMYRPGSHRLLAEDHHEAGAVANFTLDKLPTRAYAEPVPLLAKKGQISVGSTGVVHSGSVNTDTQDRKVIFTQFQAKGVTPVAFPAPIEASTGRFAAAATPLFAADRRHLLRLGA